MILSNEKYKVTIFTGATPDLDGYSVLYRNGDLDFYFAHLIQIESSHGESSRFALVNFLLPSTEKRAVLEDNILTILLFSKIIQIDLHTNAILRCVDCENMGGLEQIHSIDNGYIIKGEGEIFRYDRELNQIWQFCGRDIFAHPTANECFGLENGIIHCRDWAGWHYTLDLDKNLIAEVLENSK